MRPRAIDLFCGLGGWSEALLALGYRVVGFDIEAHEYGEHRYPGKLVVQDVLTIHGSQFKDAALIVASPPCQEYSYMAMPWKIAKAKAAAIRADATGAELERLNRLFNACFRIQKEASVAAGHHIPMVVENVRGAIPWVGRSRWNFGSFHLWGDVPALMPFALRPAKVPGFRFDGSGRSFQSASVQHEGMKNGGAGSWFNIGPRGETGEAQNPRNALAGETGIKNPGRRLDPGPLKFNDRIANFPADDGRKQPGLSGTRTNGKGDRWFQDGAARSGSKSPARKAASAMIAKIPFPLASHIGKTYWPKEAA